MMLFARYKWLLIITFLSFHSFARVEVIFVEVRLPTGQVLALEPQGRFSHVAISYNNQSWLHAYPGRPVEIISKNSLLRLGHYFETLSLDRYNLSASSINYFLGKEYDHDYSWDDSKIYCSELIAKLLKLSPEPMNFNAPYWPISFHQKNGLPGLSPDKIYRRLKKIYFP